MGKMTNKIGKNTSLFQINEELNTVTYDNFYYRLKLLAMNLFEWEHLPDSVSERFLEKTLYEMGKAIWINDDEMGFLGLRCAYSNLLNVYEEPTEYMAYSINYSKQYSANDCVLIRNNYLSIPTDNAIRLYAWRLYNVERAMDVNINAQKTPVIISCPEDQRMTMKNLYAKYEGNEPFIFGYKNLDVDSIKVLKTDAPALTEQLTAYKQSVWQDALTYLGIGTANIQKTERLNIPETVLGNNVSSMSGNTMLKTRLEACDLINKKWGLNVSVKLRTDIKDAIIGMIGEDGEVMGTEGEDGEVHNGTENTD